MTFFLHSLVLPLLILVAGGNPEETSLPASDTVSVNVSADTQTTQAAPLVRETNATPVDSASIAKASCTVDSSWWSRALPNKAFGVGERLEFSVKYGTLSAGNAVLEVTSDTSVVDKHCCYHIVSVASSNDFVSVFYKVRDIVESYIDVPGIFSRRFNKNISEGNYKINRETLFDQQRHLAITGKDSISTFAFVQDPLSSLYYIRTQELVPGKDILIDSHTDRKNYPIKVKVLGRERVEVPAGKFNCIVVEPVMRSDGIFKAKGNIKIWLTDDQYKMPVMMRSEVYILGSINAQLSKYTHGKTFDEQVQKD